MGVLYEKFRSDTQLLAEQVQTIAQQQKATDKKLDLVIETIAEIKVELSEINDKLEQKVDREDHQALERRVSRLETAS